MCLVAHGSEPLESHACLLPGTAASSITRIGITRLGSGTARGEAATGVGTKVLT